MPLFNNKLQRRYYMDFIQKLENKLPNWKASMLSVGGRVTLMNATLTAMPIYMMQTFLLPKWVIKKIDRVRRSFLWHGHKNQDSNHMSLVAWEQVIRPKKIGGMGVLNMQTMNKALLARILWKWVHTEKPPWMCIPIGITPTTRPWQAENPTSLRISLKAVWPLMSVSVSYTLGQGTHIRFWDDIWKTEPLRYTYPTLYSLTHSKDMTVQQAKTQNAWIAALLQEIASQTQEDLIQKAQTEYAQLMHKLEQTTLQTQQDVPVWKWATDGLFTVKSFYRAHEGGPIVHKRWSAVWKIKVPFRISIFGWFMLKNNILTTDNRNTRGWQLVSICYLCKRDSETVEHIFRTCSFTTQLRCRLHTVMPVLRTCQHSASGAYQEAILYSKNKEVRQLELTSCFVIWRERYKRIFAEEHKTLQQIEHEVIAEHKSLFPSGQISAEE